MLRIRLRDGHTEFAGRPIEWAAGMDGVEVAPGDDSGGVEVRQIVQDRLSWECTTWVSRAGVVYDRCFDPFRNTFLWSVPKTVGMDPHTGHFTTVVGRDTDLKRSMRLTRAIAMAWVEPPRVDVKLQACVLPGREPIAENIVWVRTGIRDIEFDGVQEEPRPAPFAGDTSWRPLVYVWRNLCGEIVGRIDERSKPPGERYEVSVRGWVRSPHGGVAVRGVRTANGRVAVSIAGVGAVWIDEAVLCTFDEVPADGIVTTPRHINGQRTDNSLGNLAWSQFLITQPRHDEVLSILNRGGSLDDLCTLGIRRSTAWDRISSAAWELPYERVLERIALLAPEALRHVLAKKMESGELDAADTMSRCVEVCDAELCDGECNSTKCETWGKLDLHDRYGLVKIARCIVLRAQLQG